MAGTWTDRMLYDACQKTGSFEQVEAFEFLFHELYARVYLMVTRTNYPEPESLAKDCAQEAIIKVWKSLDTCREPDRFLAWSKKVARNHTLNELIKLGRLHEVTLEDEEYEQHRANTLLPQKEIEQREWFVNLMYEFAKAPWSPLSKKVMLGNFLEDKKDAKLAEELSQSEGRPMRPSHIQVIRTKDRKKLHENDGLSALLRDWLE
ncbi:MAG TPA: sigma-70 family RNA polymerase sigma factor [Anaerolineales bacterium]|nr:sigma-70 family RNA polymerase sigma factor [Anaerolineales bacterium]